MTFKHTRRATSRTERRSDGSEIVERSEEETFEDQGGSRGTSLRPRTHLLGRGLSALRRLFRRCLGLAGTALFIGAIKELIGRLMDHPG